MSAIIFTKTFDEKANIIFGLPVNNNGEVENAFDGFSHTYFNPLLITTNFAVRIIPTNESKIINFLSISGHNFKNIYTGVTSVFLQGSNSGSDPWSDIVGLSTNDILLGINVAFLQSGSVVYDNYRLLFEIDNAVDDIKISNIFIGLTTVLPNNIKPSYILPKLSELSDIKNNMTIGGNFIGRSILNRQYQFEIKQNNVSQQWLIDNWTDLLKIIQRQSFMFLWSDTDLSDMVFCWTDGDIKAPVYDDQLYGSFNIKCSGYIENGS